MKPLIELTIDELDKDNPTFCSPYVWIVRIENCDGCAVDVGFYRPEEAVERVKDFLTDTPVTIFRYTFEAIAGKLHEIAGSEAENAILLAPSRYFEEGDAPYVDASQFGIKRDINFSITTAWNGETDCFTLCADGELQYTVENNCRL